MKTKIKITDKMQFNVIFTQEEKGGFTASVPSLPGCLSYGKNLIEAKKMIIDAIIGYIESMKKHGEHIPTDTNSFIEMTEVPLAESYA